MEILLYVAAGLGVVATVVKLIQWAGRFGKWCADVKIAMDRAEHYDTHRFRFIKDSDDVWKHYQREYWHRKARGEVK